jgi:hypothetical protein
MRMLHRRLPAAAVPLVVAGLLMAAAGASAYTGQLRRAPYLTDAAAGGATVNWATDRTLTSGSVKWGRVGVESCTAHTTTASRSSITVNGAAEYQWKARLALPDDTAICYRVFGGTTDLLGTDPTPQFTTRLPAGSSTPFSFAVFGDWGQDLPGGNPDQAGVMRGVANSGARFAVITGDTAYPSGTQTNYGDLVATGTNVSGVFAPNYWTLAGASTPLFPVTGNHGFTSTFPAIWPTTATAAASGGRFTTETYCCTNGTTSATYPSAWYAFDEGGVRFYMLEASWADGNIGTATAYQNDFDNHWTPSSPEYQWLANDLASHPSQLKIAAFHYPLFVDNGSEPSDTLLQGPNSLQGLLDRYGVNLVFNGHAHVYERNQPDAAGLVTYVTGGGGEKVEPVSHCSVTDAYAIGWSYSTSKGSRCGAAVAPTSQSQVFHFLLVHVDGQGVTVTPTDSTGRTFDVTSYSFTANPPPDTTPPSAPPTVTASAASPTRVDVSWGASTDDVGVTGYTVLRDGTAIATVTQGRTYSDTTAQPDTTYTYSVEASDAAGNTSDATAATPVTTPADTSGTPAFVRDATGSTPLASTFGVPLSTTAGDALVASIAIQAGSTASVTKVSDTAGNTWTKGPVGLLSGSSTRVELWYATNADPVSGVTVTLSAEKAAAANVAEFSGVAGAAALDVSAGSGSASSTTAATPTIATTNATDLLVGAVNYPGTATAELTGTGFTALSPFAVSTLNGRAAYRVVSATGSWSAVWTLSKASTSGGAILALKGA